MNFDAIAWWEWLPLGLAIVGGLWYRLRTDKALRDLRDRSKD